MRGVEPLRYVCFFSKEPIADKAIDAELIVALKDEHYEQLYKTAKEYNRILQGWNER